MSTFWKPRWALCAVPRLSLVQWQSAMLPLLSTTATSATSGLRVLSRTVMYTGNVCSMGVFRYPPAP